MLDDPPKNITNNTSSDDDIKNMWTILWETWNTVTNVTTEEFIRIRDLINEIEDKNIEQRKNDIHDMNIFFQMIYIKLTDKLFYLRVIPLLTSIMTIGTITAMTVSTAITTSERGLIRGGIRAASITVPFAGVVVIINSVIDLKKKLNGQLRHLDELVKDKKQDEAFLRLNIIATVLNVGGYYIIYDSTERTTIKETLDIKLSHILNIPGKEITLEDILKRNFGIFYKFIETNFKVEDYIEWIFSMEKETFKQFLNILKSVFQKDNLPFVLSGAALIGVVLIAFMFRN
jgi:hypothetical protein